MKKIGLLLILTAMTALAQDAASAGDANAPQGTAPTSNSFPVERIQTPTYADLYCAGFISKQVLPNSNYVAGGLQTPNTTKFVTGDIIYIAGSGNLRRRWGSWSAPAEAASRRPSCAIMSLWSSSISRISPPRRRACAKPCGSPAKHVGTVFAVRTCSWAFWPSRIPASEPGVNGLAPI